MFKRKTVLFVPGNTPAMLISAPVLGADSVIFDLEDAVSQSEKDAARILVREAYRTLKCAGLERIVRINGLDTPFWEDDIRAVVSAGVDTVLLPKCDSCHVVEQVSEVLLGEERRLGLELHSTQILPIIESALAVENAFQIACSDTRVTGLLLGAEDLAADLMAKRSLSGEEIAYARGRVVNAARAASIDAIDTPFTVIDDLDNLRQDAELAKQMGFTGKALISPLHTRVVNQVFAPSEQELDWAKRIIIAMKQAESDKKGAFSVDGAMVDGPIVKRALRILNSVESAERTSQCMKN
ncbi:HpcH/HpaI aldolase/citrate lyase family protein [Thaumasiovibrio sp. DFM-14]|uniref:HpcH/HpaI aldolase/citrate lyase family protein n=1 Tax=Thaumasiovibrio sp. DFM-14 TaxID=3384792 RepID=UPI00399FAFCE